MNDSVGNKVVLITGASAGIGAALAHELASRHSRLLLVARRQDRLQVLAEKLRAGGAQVEICVGDVSRDGDMEQAVKHAHATFGALDIVIANAGFSIAGPMAKFGLDDFRRQMETNLFGVLRTYIATRDDLLAQRGRLVVIGSVNGYVALPGVGPYSMSKYAVRSFCDILRQELRPAGVAVTHIVPGFIESEIRQIDNRGVLHPNRKDPVPRILLMPAAQAARETADAIERRAAECILTRHGQLGVLLGRHAPSVLETLLKLTGIKWSKERLKHKK